METTFECRVVVQEESVGYYHRRVVAGDNIYEFTVNLATALIEINQQVAELHKVKQFEEMEKQGELPF